jgi:hypothetical protein
MSDNSPFSPPSQADLRPGPAVLITEARIDPPQDVTAAMAGFKAACDAWKPVSIEGIPRYSAEAELCDQITSRTDPGKTGWNVGLVTGIAWTLVAVFTFIVIRDTYRGIRRMLAVRLIRPFTTPTAE